MDPLSKYSLLVLIKFYLPKLLTALVCGGIVGFERERKHKVAGFKTNILICTGAMLFTATSLLIAESSAYDPLRVISYVVSGIGFLGAGAIFKSHDRVHGLTTAAFIWCISAIGVIVGCGGYSIALLITTGMVTVVLILSKLEEKYLYKE